MPITYTIIHKNMLLLLFTWSALDVKLQTLNFELLMLNIKIKLQQKWTKYFHISKFEKSQMDKMNYTWKKLCISFNMSYVHMYASKPSNHDANYFTTSNSLLLNEKYICMSNKKMFIITQLYFFFQISRS